MLKGRGRYGILPGCSDAKNRGFWGGGGGAVREPLPGGERRGRRRMVFAFRGDLSPPPF